MPALANSRHEAFAQSLARGSSIAAAYAEAGYKPNRGNAHTLLKQNKCISKRVEEIQAEGPVMKTYDFIRLYVERRLRHWLMPRTGGRGRGFEQYSQDYLHDTLGLFRIPRSRDDLPRAKAWWNERKPGAGNLHARFDEQLAIHQQAAAEAAANAKVTL
jgi:hypothetical protein